MYSSKYFSTRSRFDLMIIVNITNFCHASFNYNYIKVLYILSTMNRIQNRQNIYFYMESKNVCAPNHTSHFSLTLANISKR